jgi:hypothetical protein
MISTLLVTILFLLLALPSALRAQGSGVQYSISDDFRYGIGQQFDLDNVNRKEYFENLLATRLYLGDLTVGFRLQVDKPREYGRDTVGIKEYYAEYRRDGLRARGGTFYNLVGRGLVMNTFESRPIGFDTQTEGVRLDYDNGDIAAGAWGGVMNYPDIINSKRVEEYRLRGASGEVRPIRELSIGGSFLSASGNKTAAGFIRPFDAYLREVYAQGNYGGFRTYINYADKRTVIDSSSRTRTTSPFYGYGYYGLAGYNAGVFSITAELKDYRFDLLEPSEQQIGSRSTRALPFQNPPTLIPEYDKALLARNPHTPDHSDELGFHLEALFYPSENLTLTLLAVGGSRHNAWTKESVVDSNGTTRSVFTRINDAPRSFAELSDIAYSPYWEAYAHGEYELNDDLTFALGVQTKDNFVFDLHEQFKATTVMLESIASIASNGNLHSILEIQRVYDSKKIFPAIDSLSIPAADGKFLNLYLTLEYSSAPRWSVNTRIEFTTNKREQEEKLIDPVTGAVTGLKGKQIWPVVGGTYRIGNAHTLGLQYGAERGGVVCTGGVCRTINPFEGFRLTLVSKL